IRGGELDEYRSMVESFTLDFMHRAMARGLANGHWDDVIRFCHVALFSDPFDEEAMRQGVKAYESKGCKVSARKLYDSFMDFYRRCYGVKLR
ncbi:MAG: hypothetical protein K2K95_07075, partial [Muribaculaceae bacterium]|nr:hypothetical protein [Muribaculaceae bacterium]